MGKFFNDNNGEMLEEERNILDDYPTSAFTSMIQHEMSKMLTKAKNKERIGKEKSEVLRIFLYKKNQPYRLIAAKQAAKICQTATKAQTPKMTPSPTKYCDGRS